MSSSAQAEAVHRAYEALERDEYAEARRLFLERVEAAPNDAVALHGLGRAEALMERYVAAVQAFERAVRANPRFALAHNDMGRALFALNRHADAEAAFGRAVEIDPRLWDAWNNRGLMLSELKRWDAAVEAFEHAFSLRPQFAAAYINGAMALSHMGRAADALKALELAANRVPNAPGLARARGTVLLQAGRPGDALPHLDDAIGAKPNDVDAHHRRGEALAALGRSEDARTAFEQALALDGARTDTRQALADLGPALPLPVDTDRGPIRLPTTSAAPQLSVLPPPAEQTPETAPIAAEPPTSARSAPIRPLIPVSVGELVDRLTHIELKLERNSADIEREPLGDELELLRKLADESLPDVPDADDLRLTLRAINEAIWDIQDHLRDYERTKVFDEVFVDLARNIAILDEQRNLIRAEIDRLVHPNGAAA